MPHAPYRSIPYFSLIYLKVIHQTHYTKKYKKRNPTDNFFIFSNPNSHFSSLDFSSLHYLLSLSLPFVSILFLLRVLLYRYYLSLSFSLSLLLYLPLLLFFLLFLYLLLLLFLLLLAKPHDKTHA